MSGKNYKLTYLSARGMAEPIRFLLLHSGQKFEEHLFLKEEWAALKPQLPFGMVPVLEIEGKKIHQSKAICRYLARQSGMAGSNDWEGLQIDAVVDTIDDLRQNVYDYFNNNNDATEATKAKKLETLIKETLPFYLSKFETQAKENGGYLAIGKLSWADFYYATQTKNMAKRLGSDEYFTKYPTLNALCDKVYAIPKIAEFVAKREPYAY